MQESTSDKKSNTQELVFRNHQQDRKLLTSMQEMMVNMQSEISKLKQDRDSMKHEQDSQKQMQGQQVAQLSSEIDHLKNENLELQGALLSSQEALMSAKQERLEEKTKKEAEFAELSKNIASQQAQYIEMIQTSTSSGQVGIEYVTAILSKEKQQAETLRLEQVNELEILKAENEKRDQDASKAMKLLQDMNQEIRQDRVKAISELEELKMEVGRLGTENKRLNQVHMSDHEESKKTIRDLQERAKQAEAACSNLHNKINDLHADNKIMAEEFDLLKMQLGEHYKEVKRSIEDGNDIRHRSANDIHNKIQGLKKSLKDVLDEYEKHKVEIIALKAELEKQKQDFNNAMKEEMSAVMESLASECVSLRKEADSKNSDRMKNDQEVKDALNEAHSRIEKSQIRMAQLELVIVQNRKEIDALLSRNEALQQEAESTNSDRMKNNQEVKDALKVAQTRMEEAQIRMAQLELVIAQHQKEIDTLLSKNEALQKAGSISQKVIEKMKKRHHDAKSAADSERDQLRQEMLKLRSECEKLKKDLESRSKASIDSNTHTDSKKQAVTPEKNSAKKVASSSSSKNNSSSKPAQGQKTSVTPVPTKTVAVEPMSAVKAKSKDVLSKNKQSYFNKSKSESSVPDQSVVLIENTDNKLQIPREAANKFFVMMAKGMKHQVRGCIKANQKLIDLEVSVKINRKYCFEKITAFQFALYFRDPEMCAFLITQIGKEAATRQKHAFDKSRSSDNCYSFNKIIRVIEEYCANYESWYAKDRIKYWAQEVGKEQADLPAWVIHLWSTDTLEYKNINVKNSPTEITRKEEWFDLWYCFNHHILSSPDDDAMGWSRDMDKPPNAIYADGHEFPSKAAAQQQLDFLRKVSKFAEDKYLELCKDLSSQPHSSKGKNFQ